MKADSRSISSPDSMETDNPGRRNYTRIPENRSVALVDIDPRGSGDQFQISGQ
ncbi:MAG: hypothetical protein O3C15_03510 [Proteobacteria bacterium]|nr:hypothetical protein [Pseudomonadota bacterium]